MNDQTSDKALEKILVQLADKVMGLDEASLTYLLPRYKKRMEEFEPGKDWERAVIIFFLINSVRVKNSLFNDNLAKAKKEQDQEKRKEKKPRKEASFLKLVKS